MGIFDNATKLEIGDKEVSSIKIGTAFLYKKEEQSSNDLTFAITLTQEDYDAYHEVYGFLMDSRPFRTGDEDSCTVDWGDETTPTEYDYLADGIDHSYSQSGTYTITITAETVTELDGGLRASNITSMSIPSTVSDLDECFGSGLTEITFMGSVPPSSNGAFTYASSLTTIRVPSGSLSAYQNAENYPESGVTYVEY